MDIENANEKININDNVPSEWNYLFLVTDDSIEDVLNNYTIKELIELKRKLDFFRGL